MISYNDIIVWTYNIMNMISYWISYIYMKSNVNIRYHIYDIISMISYFYR